MKEYILLRDSDLDVYCYDCKQLRLWGFPKPPTRCANCNSSNIKHAPVGDPELEKLRWPNGIDNL